MELPMDVLSPRALKSMRRNAAEAAAMLRMLSHEARLAVLCELSGGERSAGALVESSGLSQSALSQHLAKLRDEGLVKTRRDGQTIYYALADDKAARIISVLHDIYCGKR
jgi:ArsR family transcriptional regulator